jgi:diacylglycerol kinase family enzyme
LQADFKLEAHDTTRRDHAIELATEAVDRDFDAVLAFGGDGTINEVVQPLVGTGIAFGLIPGGTTNVMARSLGMPTDPVEATAFVAEHLRNDTRRRIGLGSLSPLTNGGPLRYFLFSCGIGLDAEVVKRVEAAVTRTGRKSDWTFVRNALAAASMEYRGAEPWLTVTVGGDEFKGVLGICGNAWPFTYFKRWPINACPQARLDAGLDMLVFGKIRATTIPRVIRSVFGSGSHAGWRKNRYWHDVDLITWKVVAPKPVQVDGDYIGEFERVEFGVKPGGLLAVS